METPQRKEEMLRRIAPLLLKHGAAVDQISAEQMAAHVRPHVAAALEEEQGAGDGDGGVERPAKAGGGVSFAGVYFSGAYTVQRHGVPPPEPMSPSRQCVSQSVVAIQVEVAAAGRCTAEGRAGFSVALVGAALEWLQCHYGFAPSIPQDE